MKRSVIEQKLNEAMIRRSSAQNEDWRLTRDIDYHDRQASTVRKERQRARNKKDRADATIAKLSALLNASI